ncbi:MAG: hypothetical protein ACRYGN_10605 [Janthinobacterium lividum]
MASLISFRLGIEERWGPFFFQIAVITHHESRIEIECAASVCGSKTTSEHQVQQNMPIPVVAADSKSGLAERQMLRKDTRFLYRLLIKQNLKSAEFLSFHNIFNP